MAKRNMPKSPVNLDSGNVGGLSFLYLQQFTKAPRLRQGNIVHNHLTWGYAKQIDRYARARGV